MRIIKRAYGKIRRKISRARSGRRWIKQLHGFEKKIVLPLQPLTNAQKAEIKEYYAQFGFMSIRTDWHRYINSVAGLYFPKLLPEDFFHAYLERTYNIGGGVAYAWEDKAFMPVFLDCVKFPETIGCNANGYFYDKNMEMISAEQAKKRTCKTKKDTKK